MIQLVSPARPLSGDRIWGSGRLTFTYFRQQKNSNHENFNDEDTLHASKHFLCGVGRFGGGCCVARGKYHLLHQVRTDTRDGDPHYVDRYGE
jgi:hypothetical protein